MLVENKWNPFVSKKSLISTSWFVLVIPELWCRPGCVSSEMERCNPTRKLSEKCKWFSYKLRCNECQLHAVTLQWVPVTRSYIAMSASYTQLRCNECQLHAVTLQWVPVTRSYIAMSASYAQLRCNECQLHAVTLQWVPVTRSYITMSASYTQLRCNECQLHTVTLQWVPVTHSYVRAERRAH